MFRKTDNKPDGSQIVKSNESFFLFILFSHRIDLCMIIVSVNLSVLRHLFFEDFIFFYHTRLLTTWKPLPCDYLLGNTYILKINLKSSELNII